MSKVEDLRIKAIASELSLNGSLADFDFEGDFHVVMAELHQRCRDSAMGSNSGMISSFLTINRLTNARIDYLTAG